MNSTPVLFSSAVLIILSIFKKQSRVDHSQEKTSLSLLFYGFGFMIIDLTTMVLYIAAVKIILEAKLSFGTDFLIFAAIIIIIMSTMALPVFLATLAPQKSAPLLAKLKNFVDKHGLLINKIVIILIALYLIYKGARFFWS